MRRPPAGWITGLVVVLGGFAAIPAVHGQGVKQGEKYALLVGVRQYDPNQLRNLPYAEADVEALAQLLVQAGYRKENVVVMTQMVGANQARFLPLAANIRKELAGLLRDRAPADSVLVALAGHGVQFVGNDDSYFCPMDARLQEKQTLVGLAEMYQNLKVCPAGFKLLLVDACRNDPQADHSRAQNTVKLQSKFRPQQQPLPGGVAALFSCSPGERAFEHDKLKHGVFFHFVIEGLKGAADLDGDSVVEVEELALYTRRRVADFVRAEYGADVRQMPNLVSNTRGSMPVVNLQYAARAALERGNGLLAKRQHDQAVEAYTEAIRLDARLKGVYVQRGHAYREKNQLDQASADYSRAIQLNPNDSEAYTWRGISQRYKDHAKAIADLDEAIRLNPKNANLFNTRGLVHLDKNSDKAVADFTEALRMAPQYAAAFNNRALAYGLKNPDKALADYKEALRLNPRYTLALTNRAWLYQLQKDYARALGDYTEALKIEPNNAAFYRLRGDVYRTQKEYSKALADYGEAIRIDPRDAQAVHNRALVYRALGEQDFAAATRLNPNLKAP